MIVLLIILALGSNESLTYFQRTICYRQKSMFKYLIATYDAYADCVYREKAIDEYDRVDWEQCIHRQGVYDKGEYYSGAYPYEWNDQRYIEIHYCACGNAEGCTVWEIVYSMPGRKVIETICHVPYDGRVCWIPATRSPKPTASPTVTPTAHFTVDFNPAEHIYNRPAIVVALWTLIHEKYEFN